jgi:outer membrane protein assembly factor BamB
MNRIRTLCLLAPGALLIVAAMADDWPQWLGEKRDGVWRETGIVEKFPESGPKLVWKLEIGSGYSGPAVADGRVFVSDRVLEKDSEARENPFERGRIAGQERIHCIDAASGEMLWTHTYDCPYTVSYAAGPRATPAIAGDLVYSLGAEGDLRCLRVEDGSVVWKRDFKQDYAIKTPMWGFAAAPLIDGDNVICLVGGEGAVAVAFDRRSGEEKWKALSAREPGYAPPTIIEHAGHRQLIVWHPESVNALNPETGAVLWTIPWKLRSGLSIPTPRQQGDRLFFTCFYNGSLMLKLSDDGSAPEVQWQTERESERRTTHLNSIMSTPYFSDGHIYGVCSYGEFRCLEMASGDRVWESMQLTTGAGEKERWANVFFTPHAPSGRWFLFTESGDLVIAKLSAAGLEELDRARIIEPNGIDMRRRKIVWSHPAYADRSCFVRNDNEIRRISLAR